MKRRDRSNVWLAAAGIVIQDGKWLVVKKRYGGLKGLWSIPAGFVNEGETVDQAAVREVLEETGIETVVEDIVGLRTGVINETISDNMVVFLLQQTGGTLSIQQGELEDVAFMTKEQLEADPNTSMMVHLFLQQMKEKCFEKVTPNPGDVYQYSTYKIFC